MTASAAGYLAEVFGGEGTTIDEFAGSLPPAAKVLDIGAGRSDLGLAVALRREDVDWVNLDVQYGSDEKRGPLEAAAEEAGVQNLRFVPGSVLALPDYLRGWADNTYVFNLVSHLLHIRRDIGHRAVVGSLDTLDVGGELSMGPIFRHDHDLGVSMNAVRLGSGSAGREIETALDAMTIPRLKGLVLDATNASGVSIFDARRFDPEATGHLFFDHHDETCHPPLSLEGAKLAVRLMAGFFQRNRFEDPPAISP